MFSNEVDEGVGLYNRHNLIFERKNYSDRVAIIGFLFLA